MFCRLAQTKAQNAQGPRASFLSRLCFASKMDFAARFLNGPGPKNGTSAYMNRLRARERESLYNWPPAASRSAEKRIRNGRVTQAKIESSRSASIIAPGRRARN
jgi:hypothetical protein